MSFMSRSLFAKTKDTKDSISHRNKKQKPILVFNSLGKQKQTKQKYFLSSTSTINYNNTNNEKNINKALSKINYSNVFPQLNITKTNENNNTVTNDNIEKVVKLNYKKIQSSSEDIQYPLKGLKKGLDGPGWKSDRFCLYPQFIYVQFSQPVLIKRIEIVFHETNIPSLIKFLSYLPKDKNDYTSNLLQVNYDYIGSIRIYSNEGSNFSSKQSRKVYINSKALFFKIELEKNYLNKKNVFNQVGLSKLDFYGENLPYSAGDIKNNKLILKQPLKRNIYSDMDLDTICQQQLTNLKKQMNYNIEIDNYQECKEILNKIEKVRLYNKRIFDLESEKNTAINNNDFSKVIEINNLVDKLKINLQNMDNMPNSPTLNDINLIDDKDTQLINNKKLSDISIDLNNSQGVSNNYENNDSIDSTLNNNNNNYNKSYKNNNSISKNNNNFDDNILPAVLKKLHYNENTKDENELDEVEKEELEEISENILYKYKLIVNVIGEENMRKIFSKKILWKEEGLKFFIHKIGDIIKNNNNNNNNVIISLVLNLSMELLEEKHPSIVIRALKIIEQLFEYIKINNINLDINGEITDGLLIKIKEKLGDVNPKVRTKSVSLYCYMLSLNFCDYNNLISELIKEDIINNNKYIPKSINIILGKLDIIIYTLNNFDDAINMKRTDKQKFPSDLVMKYLIFNISHNKAEVREKTRIAMKLFLSIFDISKFKNILEKIEEKQLSKLKREIPDLRKYI